MNIVHHQPYHNTNIKILHDKVLTAGWDRLACIWDVDTGELLQVARSLTTLKKKIFCISNWVDKRRNTSYPFSAIGWAR